MIYRPVEPTEAELLENHQRFLQRTEAFLRHGFDRQRAIGFIIDNAAPIEQPILDIGTGKGLAAIEVASRGIPVTSVDISEDELKVAFLNARAANVDAQIRFHIGDANKLPFEDGNFRLVTMVNVLHHIDEFTGIFREVSRVLIPGGRFVVADFTEDGFAVMERIHRSEGGEHSRLNNVAMDDVALMLPRFGLECRARDTRFLEHVIVAEKL
jgi:ubiquinone/menaquinone biosynthesis C-methylase UbiE